MSDLKIGDMVEVVPVSMDKIHIGQEKYFGLVSKITKVCERRPDMVDGMTYFILADGSDIGFAEITLRKIKPDHQPCEEAFSDELKLMLKGKVSA